LTLENKQNKKNFDFDKQEVRELREDELNGESEDELIFINFERKYQSDDYFSSSNSSFGEKFESNSTISPIYEENEEEEEEELETEENKNKNFKGFNEDIIPFDDFEYEKIAPSSPATSLTPTFRKSSGNFKQMSRLLSSMNQYYSLTNINNYNIDDQTSSGTDDIQQQQPAALPLPTHLDIGYSSDNERIDSPETNQIKINQHQQNFYMMKNRKSYSDHHMSSSSSKKMNKYKNFFSRYSRSKILNSDDEYVADEDDDCVTTCSSLASTESSSGGGNILHAYKIPSFKKSRMSKSNSDDKKNLSNTTSAYDTSSNLSNEGHFNTINKEFQNNELNQNEGNLIKTSLFLKKLFFLS
jgi:hypothetical protein